MLLHRKLNTSRIMNNIGKASSILLLLFLLLAMNPLLLSSADTYANEPVTTTGSPGGVATSNTSSVSIGLVTDYSNATITPTNAEGEVATVDTKATIAVTNAKTYSVYVSSNSDRLSYNNESFIEPLTNSVTGADNIPVNRWGYSFNEGDSASETYKAVSTTSPIPDYVPTENINGDDTKLFTIKFATKVNTAIPAGEYKGDVAVSVVASPIVITMADITDMQEMTSTICDATAPNYSKQLRDTRDGKYYWVTKLKSDTAGNYRCWMTQNLDLDLTADTTPLTSEKSDLPSGYTWTPRDNNVGSARYTATSVTDSTIINSDTAQRSWSLGDYYITNPTNSSNCGAAKNSAVNCTNQFTKYTPSELTLVAGAIDEELAHWILGNHYSWMAATAGNGDTSASICPKGWQLPTSNSVAAGSFEGLINGNAIGSDVAVLTSKPYYFVRNGFAGISTDQLFKNAGDLGSYWSSVIVGKVSARILIFSGADTITPSESWARQYGAAIRCVARTDN